MRKTFIVAALLLAAFASAPTVAAYSESGSVSTGEGDSYGGKYKECPTVMATWEITLTLQNPSPTDAVSLSAQGLVTTVADVATAENPTATVTVANNHGCVPPIQVTGLLVDGSVDYTLDY